MILQAGESLDLPVPGVVGCSGTGDDMSYLESRYSKTYSEVL